MKIIVAVNNVITRETLSDFLGKMGHVPICCTEYLPLLGLLSQEDGVDMVFTGPSLSGLEGVDLIGLIRSLDRFGKIPVVVVSSLANENTDMLLDAGADDFIKAPVDYIQLKRTVEFCLNYLKPARKL